MKKLGNVLWGLVFIVIGLIIGLNAMGFTNINIFFNGWWTFFIIIPSLIGLIKHDDKTWSLIWFIIGIVLFLCAQRVLSFTIMGKLIFPFILVMIGLSFIFKDLFQSKMNEQIHTLNNATNGNSKEFCATFGAVINDFKGEEFNGANVDAVFGTVKLDLSNATIAHDQVINANAIFGGIDILVPNNINIKIKSTPIFGGVSNKTKNVNGDNLPTLYVNGFCLFGGVNIK